MFGEMFRVVYYASRAGEQPVRAFVSGLSQRARQKFYTHVEHLEALGPRLPMPQAKPVGRGLYELRIVAPEGHYRIFYFFHGPLVVLVHAIHKKTPQILHADLELALARKRDFEARERKGEIEA